MTTQQINDFVIMGPAMVADNKVLEAVHALYFLPENFRLVLSGSAAAEQSLQQEVMALVARDNVAHRVEFAEAVQGAQAVITADIGAPGAVSGDSAEALASAILAVARGR